MPFGNDYPSVEISSITIERDSRQRREINTEDLQKSIARNGLINPIVVNKDLKLIAGERRLEACKALGWSEIPVRFWEDLSEIDSKIIELEENAKRQDLTWQERVRAVAEIHQLFVSGDSEWTQAETAQAIAVTESLVSKYLKIAKYLDDPRIAESRTVNEAEHVLGRREQRILGDRLEQLLDGIEEIHGESKPSPSPSPSPSLGVEPTEIILENISTSRIIPRAVPRDPILCEDFTYWAPDYSGPKFNLIHCDFPYGIDMFSGPKSRGANAFGSSEADPEFYSDTPEVYFSLVETLCRSLERIASQSSHLVFWYSAQNWPKTQEIFSRLAPQVIWHHFPLIWLKSDNAGIGGANSPRHVYETAMLGTIGGRKIISQLGDAYSCPTDKKLHPSTKPEPMMRHFLGMLVDDSTRMLDPTAGSGAALRAAESLGAQQILGLELDPEIASMSNQYYRNWKSLRSGA